MEFVKKIIIDHFRQIMLENSNIKFHSLFYDKISKNCHRAANQYVYDSISVIFEPIRIKMVQFLLFSNRSLNVINIEESVLMRVVTLTMIVFDKSVIQCVLMSPHNNSGLVYKNVIKICLRLFCQLMLSRCRCPAWPRVRANIFTLITDLFFCREKNAITRRFVSCLRCLTLSLVFSMPSFIAHSLRCQPITIFVIYT